MTKILLTGASGFIGKMVVENLLATSDCEIHAVYNSRKPQFSKAVFLHKADLFNPKEVEDLFLTVSPSHLVQLAWCSNHGTYWKDYANFEWVSANFAIARSFVKNGGKRCVFIGTSAEYDWSVQQPLNEFSTPLIPQLFYGGAKLGLYWALTRFFEQESISMVWGRLFNPFGPNEDSRRLIPKICLRLLRGEKIEFDAGSSLRDFLHVDDVGAAIASLLLGNIEGPVNIGSGNPLSIRDLLSQIAAYYSCNDCITFAAPRISNDKPDMVIADIERLTQESKFKPKKSFTTRLQETCKWWADHN